MTCVLPGGFFVGAGANSSPALGVVDGIKIAFAAYNANVCVVFLLLIGCFLLLTSELFDVCLFARSLLFVEELQASP